MGGAPLHRAVLGEPKPELVTRLLESGAAVDAQSGCGDTPLHAACENGHFESVQRLITYGARVTLLNHKGESALDRALEHGQDAIVWLLIGGSREALPHFVSEEAVASGGASSSGPADLAGAAYREFEKAYEAGEILPLLFWLEKLAQLHIEGKKHPKLHHLSLFQRYLHASHCLNGALCYRERLRSIRLQFAE